MSFTICDSKWINIHNVEYIAHVGKSHHVVRFKGDASCIPGLAIYTTIERLTKAFLERSGCEIKLKNFSFIGKTQVVEFDPRTINYIAHGTPTTDSTDYFVYFKNHNWMNLREHTGKHLLRQLTLETELPTEVDTSRLRAIKI